MGRLDEAIRNLEQGKEINIGEGAIKIQKIVTSPGVFPDSIDFNVSTEFNERGIIFRIAVSEQAIQNPAFDIEWFLKEKMAKGLVQHLKRNNDRQTQTTTMAVQDTTTGEGQSSHLQQQGMEGAKAPEAAHNTML